MSAAQPWFRLGSALMFAGVAFGAFGAHGLRDKLTPDAMKTYQTAVLYHFIHALALFVVAWAQTQNADARIRFAGWAFTAGVVLFSGSLYSLAVTGTRWLGAITPIGGLFFLAGWAFLACAKS